MKKLNIFIIVLILFCLFINNIHSVNSEYVTDPIGYDPWLTMHHDSNLSGYSNTTLNSRMNEGINYPIKIEDDKEYSVSSGMVIYNDVIYLQCSLKNSTEFSELRAYDALNADLIWSVKIKGPEVSITCPVIVPDLNQIFVAGAMAPEEESKRKDGSHISAIDLDRHNILWSTAIPGSIQDGLQYSKNAIYTRSIYIKRTTKDNVKYIESNSTILTKVDINDGKVIWSKKIPFSSTKGFGMVSILNDILFISGSNHISKRESDNYSWNCYAPVIVQCLNNSNGELIWENNYPDYDRVGNISIDKGQVYALLNKGYNDKNYEVSCISLDLFTGKLKWEFPQKGFYGGFVTPKFNDKYVFFASQSQYGYVFAINKENGKLKWSKQIKNEDYYINYQCSASALTNDHLILGGTQILSHYSEGVYYYTYRSLMLMLNIENGKEEWKEVFSKDHLHTITTAIYGKGIYLLTKKNDLYYYESSLPELAVSPQNIDIGEIEQSTEKTVKISIKNIGIKGLRGSVKVSDPSWLSVDKDIIDDDSTEINLVIKTVTLDLGPISGNIQINSNGGNKIINIKMVVADKTPPNINIEKEGLININGLFYTNLPGYTLNGITEVTASIIINNKNVEVDNEGRFKYEIELSEGENNISIKATDQYGNTNEEIFKIYLDTISPKIIINTQNYKLVTENFIYISGSIDDLEAILKINNELVEITKEGNFLKLVKLEKGINVINFICTDIVGNSTELKHYIVYPEKKLIILYIGRNNGEINGQSIPLDVPPMIINNSTMVPLRFIGEAIGAELQYDAVEQKITFVLYNKTIVLWINKFTAFVNDVPVSLSVPPTIIKGRTLVPVRFVSENLGAKVEWDGKTQKITITFPAE